MLKFVIKNSTYLFFGLLCVCAAPIFTHSTNQYRTPMNSSQYQTCDCAFCVELFAKTKLQSIRVDTMNADTSGQKARRKKWTVMIYMAADNNLSHFAERNIRQMSAAGSTDDVNIVVHLDIVLNGNKVSRFYLIEKNLVVHVDAYPAADLPMSSGNPKTLFAFCGYAITNFPATNYMLVLWNHGTGAINPARARIINPSMLFQFNPFTNKFDLDRSKSFLHLIETLERAVCWDDTNDEFLANETLAKTIEAVRTTFMGGKKFDIIGFDACLMAMVEVASLLAPHADILVGSEEVELGTGWNYYPPLAKLVNNTLSPEEFAQELVRGYAHSYASYTNDYTLSATRLSKMPEFEDSIDAVSRNLVYAMSEDASRSVVKIIMRSRDEKYCTYFEEKSYIDLHHFLINLKKNLSEMQPFITLTTLSALQNSLDYSLYLFSDLILANETGKNLSRAGGLSIYLPYNNTIHSSYRVNHFFKTNSWGNFVSKYVYG